MPLLSIKKVGKSGKLALWHITESLDAFLKMKRFSEEDLSILDSFTYEHRKKEWLAARILTEQLINQKDIQIIYDKHNKPFLDDSEYSISISHSHCLLAVMIDESETGVDIELIKPKVFGIKEKFMSGMELNSVQKENQNEQLTVFWCAKESLYKLYGKKELAFKKNLFIEPFQYAGKGNIKGWIKNSSANKSFTLQYEKLNFGNDDYMSVYVINQD